MQRIPRSHVVMAVLAATLAWQGCRASQPAGPPVTDDTWAVVDGRQISRGDVDKAFERTRNLDQTLSEEEALLVKLGLLDELITQDLIAARAPALEVIVTDEEVEKAFTDTKAAADEETFRKELERRQLSEDDVRAGLRRELTVQKVVQKEIADKVTVSDQEITDFFNANKEQFNLPEDAVHLAQIVVTPGPDPRVTNRTGDDATTPEVAQTKVNTLMERLRAGTPFGDLARDFSEDPDSAPLGGDLGLVPMSAIRQAPAELRDGVLNMEPGSARVVSDGTAIRIVLVVSREAAGQRDLTTPGTKEQITQALRARKEQLLRDAYLSALRADANVTNYLARRLVERNGSL